MTQLVYVITVRGFVPADLCIKVIEAHAEALTSARRQNKCKEEFRYQLATSTGTAANEN